MLRPGTHEALVVMALVLLIPLIPSVVIYKWLPAEKVTVSGKLFGLTVNAAGAFASYLLLVLVANQVHRRATTTDRPAEPFDTWTIAAIIKIEDPFDTVTKATIHLDPPPSSLNPLSRDVARVSVTAPVARVGTVRPLLTARMNSYDPVSVQLALDGKPDLYSGRRPNVALDTVNRTLTLLDTIVLRRTPMPYSPVNSNLAIPSLPSNAGGPPE